MKTIFFLPSNKINVKKNLALLELIKKSGYQLVILCIQELSPDSIAMHASVVNSGHDFECIAVAGFNKNAHWFVQRLSKRKVVSAVQTVVNKYSPDLLITAYEGGVAPYWISKECQRWGIPVVLVPDGLVLNKSANYVQSSFNVIKDRLSVFTKYLCGIGRDRGSSNPDHVMLLNASGANAFRQYDIKQRNIHVIGASEYDKRGDSTISKSSATESIYLALGVENDSALVLFAHQSGLGLTEAQEQQMVLAMVGASSSCGATLVVKLHHMANSSVSDWELWRDSQNLTPGEIVFANHSLRSIDILKISRLCITAFSTVGLEALYYEKPLMIIKYVNSVYELPYSERYKCALDVFDEKELKDGIIALLTNEKLRKELVENGSKALEVEVALGDELSVDMAMSIIDSAIVTGKIK